jgi:hypothetical protein
MYVALATSLPKHTALVVLIALDLVRGRETETGVIVVEKETTIMSGVEAGNDETGPVSGLIATETMKETASETGGATATVSVIAPTETVVTATETVNAKTGT